MAKTLIAELDVNVMLGTTTTFPLLQAGRRDTTLFYLEAMPRPTTIDTHYFLVLATLDISNNIFELPLIAKFYPKGLPLLFSVTAPDISNNQRTEIEITVKPIKRFRGATPERNVVPFSLSWED